jgi:metal-dependent amidase/aminoacylase/carboxypeptidase family protein
MNTLYQIVGRIHDARNTSILTFTRIHGGQVHNVIPDLVEFGGTLRGVDPDDQDRLLDQIRRTVHHYSALYSAEIEVDVLRGSPPVVNDEELAETAEESVVSLHGEQGLFRVPVPSMGSEDFSQYLYHIPGMMIRIGTCDGLSTSFPLHDSRFDVAEDALPLGCELVSDVLLRHLRKRAGKIQD